MCGCNSHPRAVPIVVQLTSVMSSQLVYGDGVDDIKVDPSITVQHQEPN